MKSNLSFKQLLIIVIVGVTLAVALVNLKTVLGVIPYLAKMCMPLLVGGAMAFIMNLPMNFFERCIDKMPQRSGFNAFVKKGKTAIALIATILAFILFFMFLGYVIVPNVASSIKSLAENIQSAYPGWIQTLGEHGINTDLITRNLPELNTDKIMETVKTTGFGLLSSVSKAASSVVSVLVNTVLGLFFAIYILLSKKQLGVQAKKVAYAYLPKKHADSACEIAGMTYDSFANCISGQCLEAVILAAMLFTVMIIGGFPYAPAISVIVGILNLVPYIGAFTGLIIGCLLISVVSVKKLVAFVIVFLIVQQIDAQIVYPKVVGGSLGLPALWALFAVVVGGNLYGILGMILFIPIFSVLYALFRRNVYSRLAKKGLEINEK